ncbi:sensor histidine kinase [Asanoa iriomotensis]|uniref:sensor histidine kinase n=1 Tax=Asanoa iriomotensis TaxID=234613 RepID=UPI001943688B|nr:histidine kinase [Asanoa iriomotensis]
MRRTVGDVALVAAVAGLAAAVLAGRASVDGPAEPGQWVAVVLVPLPLLARRRWPAGTLWAVLAGTLVAEAAGASSPSGVLAPLVGLYTVARHRPPRHLLAPLAVVLVGFVVGTISGVLPWPGMIGATAVVAASVLLGANSRTRQAYLSAVVERAARLERDRDREARLAVADERARIAREMHDIVAHNLAVMVALADGASYAAESERVGSAMRQVSATGRQALDEMRRLVGLLRAGGPGERVPQPGLADLDDLVGQVRAAGVDVTLHADGRPGDWGPGAGLAVYRIAQEALTNVIKHAGPGAHADLRVRYGTDDVEIEVLDDGAGRPARPPTPAGRHGLAGMAERTAPYQGTVDAGPRSGAGWRVRATLHFGPGVAA